MKNIAVLVYNVINEYYYSVVDGITSYFADKKDVRVIVSTVCVPHDTSSEFDYQYWSSVEVLKSKDVDGIIVVTNSFMDKIDFETFSKSLAEFSDRPVVSVSVPLGIENSKYTCTVPDESYEKVIEHFKTKHNRKRFAFFSASMHGSNESAQRFEAYKNALKKNNLEFNPDLVFPGDFTPGTAKVELLKKYKSKEEIDFDAIICVNDYTAAGCLLAFQELNVNCPEEVSIIGFDNTPFCLITYPTLSSVDQDIPGNGAKVAEILYRTLNGEDIDERTVLQCMPVYRQSCGCVNSKIHSTAFYDSDGNYFEIDEKTRSREQNVLLHSIETTQNLYNLLNLMDTRISMQKLGSLLQNAMGLTSISSVAACFYPTSITLGTDDDFKVPEATKILLYANAENHVLKVFTDEKAPVVNPKELLLPEECSELGAGVYFLLPLYLRDTNYGYLICKTEQPDLSLTAVHLKILTNILIHAYEVTKEETNKTKLLNENQNLNRQSKTDELTKVLNRRGFYEYGKRLLELSSSMGKSGVVFFCDLDGLKKINDTYGHEIGDLAIKTEAKVLKSAFRDSDLVGRLSGDEFGVVAPGFPLRKVDYLRERLIELNKQLSEEAGLPFTLSISIGPIEFTEKDNDLVKLLTQADKNLYEEKKIKHAKK